jgi:hypothetical protein
MKTIFSNFFYNLIMIIAIVMVLSLVGAPLFFIGAVAAALFVFQFIPREDAPEGALRAEVLKKLFSRDLQEALFPDNAFYSGCQSDEAGVETAEVEIPQDENGASEVIVNPTVFPLTMRTEEDSKKTYAADLLVTRPEVITYNNQLLISYDKRGAKLKKHRLSLEEQVADRIMYGWGNSATATYKRATTGGTTRANTAGGSNAKKIAVEADFLWAMTMMNRLNIPMDGRRLVCNPDYYEDILAIKKAYGQGTEKNNELLSKGAIDKIFTFDVFLRSKTQKYSAAGVKKALTAAAAADDGWSCIFYHPLFVRYIKGTVKTMIDPYERPDLAGGMSMNTLVRSGGTTGRVSELGALTLYQGE